MTGDMDMKRSAGMTGDFKRSDTPMEFRRYARKVKSSSLYKPKKNFADNFAGQATGSIGQLFGRN